MEIHQLDIMQCVESDGSLVWSYVAWGDSEDVPVFEGDAPTLCEALANSRAKLEELGATQI